MGRRAGQTTAGNLSTYTLTTITNQPAITPGTFNASTLAAGTFADAPAQLVDTALQPALVGQRIRVRLTAGGTGRSHFDNVRVERLFRVTTVADSGPGSLRQAVLEAAVNPGADTIVFAAPLVAGSAVGLSTDLTVADAGGITLDTTISGGSVDVAVNAGTLSFGAGSAWTGGGRILLGATSGGASADVVLAGPNGFTLAAPITVRAGSSGAKTLRAANVSNGVTTSTNTFAGAITLLAPATVERAVGSIYQEFVDFTGSMELGANLLTVTANDEVTFSGPVGRSDAGTDPAVLLKNGNNFLNLRGGGNNPRLMATVAAGGLKLQKTGTGNNLNALGSGLPAGTNALTVDAGTGVTGSGGDQIADTASVTVNGGLDLKASETLHALTGSGTVQALQPSTLTLGAASGDFTFTGSLDDSAGGTLSLTKTGTGTQTVAGGDMQGALNVNGGTLEVTGIFTANSSATLDSGATLAGSGTVRNLTLQPGSTLAPGAPGSIGTFTATQSGANSTIWNGGATALFHLSNTDATSDRLAATTLTKGSAGTFTFDFQGTGAPGVTYTLATFGSHTFTAASDFTAQNLGSNVQGGFFTLNSGSLTYTTYSTVISSAADNGPGTLRNALATVPPGSTLTFAPGMNGASIQLSTIGDTTSGNSALSVTGIGVTLDATALTGGLTLTDTGTPSPGYRAFRVAPGSSLTLRGLTVTGFTAQAGTVGGAIYNEGTLTLERCTLSGNSASNGGGGGAIFNTGGTLTLAHCTLATNRAAYGGAIVNAGGAAAATLTHCTLTLNEATGTSGGSGGGAMDNYNFAALTLRNCILAGNTSATANGPDLWMENGPLTTTGVNFIGNTTSSTLTASATILTTAANGAVNLAPLGSYGGPTPTMPPLPGSPAIDAAVASTATTDQRGFAVNDGDGNGSIIPDIGAAEANAPIVVTNNNDSGPGSLRVALATAATNPGPDTITFAAVMNGATIALLAANGQMTITDTGGVTVDASALSAGVTIDGGSQNFRLIQMQSGSNLTLRGLTLANGRTNGGAIYNSSGTLTLTRCTLSGNSGGLGGAIYNNTASITGTINSSTTLTQCTLSGNTATVFGGAVYNSQGRVTFLHCTVSGNNRGGVTSSGDAFTETVVQNSIIAGNTGDPDVVIVGPDPINSFTSLGYNRIGSGNNLVSGGNATDDFVQAGDLTYFTAATITLAPLANYGGPTQTMPPLPGSPAIDPSGGATTSPFAADQRGQPRVLDGDAVAGAIVDIGAVEYDRTMVLNLADTGPGSLRDTFTAAPSGSTLTFAPLLSGGTIPLGSEIVLNKNMTIDASTLPGGLIVDGVAATVTNRIFTVNSGQNVTLKSLTLTGGGGGGATSNTNGGAVYNNGTLTLERCTLTGNNAPGSGGAIFNDTTRTLTLTDCTLHANTTSNGGGAILNFGTLTVNKSTFSNNIAAGSGGAIQTGGTATLTHCTLAGNSCAADGNSGSAIRSNGTLTLTHCTLAGNTMPLYFAAGIFNDPGRTITMTHCILYGNSGSDIFNTGALNVTASSIIGVVSGSGTSTGTILTGNPLLAPLGNYGGPTQTMALMPGSPARNTATGSPATSDQRGFAMVGTPDIGAYEAGTFNSYTTWIWETLPTAGNGTLTDPLHATTHDFDGDGQTNGGEWVALTNPSASTSRFAATPVRNGANLEITVPTAAGRTYTLLQSDSLVGGSWIAAPGFTPQAGTGSPITFQIPIAGERKFYQIQVSVP